MNGLKYDGDKPMLDLIPPEAIMAIGRVMTYGAQKYGPNNWQGVEPRRYVAALLRHLMAYQAGEVNDPESGMPHLWHVATNAAFLVVLGGEKPSFADRKEEPKDCKSCVYDLCVGEGFIDPHCRLCYTGSQYLARRIK